MYVTIVLHVHVHVHLHVFIFQMIEDDSSHYDDNSGNNSSSDEGTSDEDETILKSTPNIITIDVSDTLAADVATQTEHTGSDSVISGCQCSAVLGKSSRQWI